MTMTPDHSSTDHPTLSNVACRAKYASHSTAGTTAAHARIDHGRSGDGRIRR